MAADDRNEDSRIAKFLRPVSKEARERAVERELDRIRPQFRFSDAELRRLRQPRRKRVA
jgi:hypothetical protein